MDGNVDVRVVLLVLLLISRSKARGRTAAKAWARAHAALASCPRWTRRCCRPRCPLQRRVRTTTGSWMSALRCGPSAATCWPWRTHSLPPRGSSRPEAAWGRQQPSSQVVRVSGIQILWGVIALYVVYFHKYNILKYIHCLNTLTNRGL